MVSSRVGVPHNLSQPGDESLMSSLWGDVPALKLGSGKNCVCSMCFGFVPVPLACAKAFCICGKAGHFSFSLKQRFPGSQPLVRAAVDFRGVMETCVTGSRCVLLSEGHSLMKGSSESFLTV